MRRLRLALLVPLLLALGACFDATGPDRGRPKPDSDDPKTGMIAGADRVGPRTAIG